MTETRYQVSRKKKKKKEKRLGMMIGMGLILFFLEYMQMREVRVSRLRDGVEDDGEGWEREKKEEDQGNQGRWCIAMVMKADR